MVAALRQSGLRVGYCKPVGQESLTVGKDRVDKDAVLFSKVMDFTLNSEIHSPVILGKGVTSAYLDDPTQFDFKDRILRAAATLHAQNELVIFEGTGHPGVGSVVDLSNADVAKMLGAEVVLIVEGGIGNTIDRLSLCLNLFKDRGVPITGVIVNKVLPEKLEKVRYYVGKKLDQIGLPLLGLLPYDKSLSFPIMSAVKDAIEGRVLANEESLDNRVEEFLSGSLVDKEKILNKQNLLLLVSYKRFSDAMKKIQAISTEYELEQCPLSGIVITGDGLHEMPVEDLSSIISYIHEHRLPLLTTRLDPLGAAIKVSKIEVKINVQSPWKSQRAIQMIREHVDLKTLLEGEARLL